MITYNHADFIAQAIESVMMQQTNFQFELVVGEDDSQDQTRSIISKYQVKYPDKIKLLPQCENIGPTPNFARTLQACDGQFIALLEGDDYWTCPNKLQKQVDFLEKNSDYSTCFHSTQLVDRAGVKKITLPVEKLKKAVYTRTDLIMNFAFMATCSVMFRNNLKGELPKVFYASDKISDWPLHMLNAEYGPIGFLDEVMAVYRSNSSDIAFTSNRLSKVMSEEIKIQKAFDEYLDYIYHDTFTNRISLCYFSMSIDHFAFGEMRKFSAAMEQSIRSGLSKKNVFKGIFFLAPYRFMRRVIKDLIN